MRSARVKFRLESAGCIQEGRAVVRQPNPFLWALFFKIDPTGVTVVRSNGAHKNLTRDDIPPGTTVRIPADIGSLRTMLRPMTGGGAEGESGSKAPLPLPRQRRAHGVDRLGDDPQSTAPWFRCS